MHHVYAGASERETMVLKYGQEIANMKIVLDALGGDNAPNEILLGAAEALKKESDLELIIVGRKDEIEAKIKEEGADLSRVEIVESDEAVLNTDHPASFLTSKPKCSLAMAYDTAKNREDVGGVVTAGPTGAVLSGAIFKLGRLPGVKRPALLATMPTEKNGELVRLLDAGANMDCKPEYLVQFAVMVNAYLKGIGLENPRIGLLNVGAEEGKGNALAKETYDLLKEADLNFVGNIEADHVVHNQAGAVVCDGFWGNIFVKTIEDTALWISGLFKGVFYTNILTKLGALTMKKHLGKISELIKAAKKASAPLLGVKKLVLKAHGKAKHDAICLSLLEAHDLLKKNIQETIAKAIDEENAKLAAKQEA